MNDYCPKAEWCKVKSVGFGIKQLQIQILALIIMKCKFLGNLFNI